MEGNVIVSAIRRGAVAGLALGTLTTLVIGTIVTAVNPIELVFSFVFGVLVGFGVTPFALLEAKARGKHLDVAGYALLALAAHVLANVVGWVAVLQAMYTQGVIHSGKVAGGFGALSEFLSPRSQLSRVPDIRSVAIYIVTFTVPIAPASVARVRNAGLAVELVTASAAGFVTLLAAALLVDGGPPAAGAILAYSGAWAVLVFAYDRSARVEQKLAAWWGSAKEER